MGNWPSSNELQVYYSDTSSGTVAENRSVWRCFGSAATIFSISDRNPISNKRSASSRIRTLTPINLVANPGVFSIWSLSLPGVATRICKSAVHHCLWVRYQNKWHRRAVQQDNLNHLARVSMHALLFKSHSSATYYKLHSNWWMEFKKLVSFCSSLVSKLTCRAHYNNTDGRPLLITIGRW